MTVALTQDALNKMKAGFGSNPTVYDALILGATKSAFFAGELNAFGALPKWTFVFGAAGSGTFTDGNATHNFISVASDWKEPPLALATALAHELGHALLPGGTSVGTLDPIQGKANSHTNEGVALLSEFVVGTQFGFTGGAAGNMHSDYYNVLTPILKEFAKGVDVTAMLYGSATAKTFTDQNSDQVIAAGNWNANNHPSIAPNLIYDQLSTAWTMMSICQVNPNKVDWTNVQPETVAYTIHLVNGVQACVFQGRAIPMKDGTTMNITGEVSPAGTVIATTFGSNTKMTEQTTFNYTGFKLQDVLYDATARKVQQYDFNLDKSSIKHDFSIDGTQTAILFGINGQMNEFVKYDASSNKTQDIFYGPNNKPTQQYDFSLDKSFVKHDFLADGTQTATLYGINGKPTEFDKFDTNNFKTQYVLYGTDQKPTQEVDIKQDHSYTKHLFNLDGTQNAINFTAANAMTQYSTFDGSLNRTQDIFYGPDQKPTKQVDFHLDKSYASHVFNPDGSQVAALFGIDGQMTQYTTFRAGDLFKTQDVFYSNNNVTKQVDYNTDHSYASHVFNPDGSQIAVLYGVGGQMTQYTNYRAGDLFKTQDLFFGPNEKPTKQVDYNNDHSYTSHVFNPDGSQIAALFGVGGQMTQYTTFRAGDLLKTQDLFYTADKLNKQVDYKPDHSYISQVFNLDGSHAAGAFGTSNKMNAYSFYDTSNFNSQNISYYENGNKKSQYDFKLDKSYTAHSFNSDGTQIATLFGIDQKVTENATFNAGLKLTQDVFYTGGVKTKGYEFNIDGTYSAHIFSGNQENVSAFSADNKITGYAEYQGTWQKNSTFYNSLPQAVETDRYNTSHALTGFTQFTYNANNTYTGHNFDSVGHALGESTYTGSGAFISGAIYTHSGGGMQLSSGGGNLFASFQI